MDEEHSHVNLGTGQTPAGRPILPEIFAKVLFLADRHPELVEGSVQPPNLESYGTDPSTPLRSVLDDGAFALRLSQRSLSGGTGSGWRRCLHRGAEFEEAAGIRIGAGAGMEEELVEAIGERGEGGANFGGVHAEDAVESPEGICCTPGRIFSATLEIGPAQGRPEQRGRRGLKGPGPTEPDPA